MLIQLSTENIEEIRAIKNELMTLNSCRRPNFCYDCFEANYKRRRKEEKKEILASYTPTIARIIYSLTIPIFTIIFH